MMMPITHDIANESELFSFSSFYWDENEFNPWQAVGYLLFKLNLRLTENSHQYLDILESYVTEIHRIEKNHFIACSMRESEGGRGNKIVIPADNEGYMTGELMERLVNSLDSLNSSRNETLNRFLSRAELNLLSGFEEVKSLKNAPSLDTKRPILGLSNPIVNKRELNDLIDRAIAGEEVLK